MAAAVAGKQAVTRQVLGRLRLASQLLLRREGGTVAETVRWMTGMQAQDFQAALWAVGARIPKSGASRVRAALDEGAIVRSWPFRGTLHLLAPEDLRWILAITSGRTVRSAAGRLRQLEITDRDAGICRDAALGLVAGGRPATRQELFTAFEAAGQSTKGQRGIHLLSLLCQDASLVPGPLAGNQQKLAAFDEWIPESRSVDREAGIAELLLRYLRSHGPATLRDFAWWSGLPLTETRAVFGAVSRQLAELGYDGTSYWLAPETAALLDDGAPGQRSVVILPGFDEFVLGYTDRSIVLPAEHVQDIVPGDNGMFKKAIVAGGQVVGGWGRDGSSRTAAVVPFPFDAVNGLRPAVQKSFELQAARYLDFLDS
jgi:hypothetical protein